MSDFGAVIIEIFANIIATPSGKAKKQKSQKKAAKDPTILLDLFNEASKKFETETVKVMDIGYMSYGFSPWDIENYDQMGYDYTRDDVDPQTPTITINGEERFMKHTHQDVINKMTNTKR